MVERNSFLVVATLCLALASGCASTTGGTAHVIRCYGVASEAVEAAPAESGLLVNPAPGAKAEPGKAAPETREITEIDPPSAAANGLASAATPPATEPAKEKKAASDDIPDDLRIIAESEPGEAPADGANPMSRDLDGAPLGIIGEVEPVFIEEIPQPFSARIDTGAAGCSLDVKEMKLFERDGKPWVSFSLIRRETGETHAFERRVVRTAQIKSASGENEPGRPVVEMKVRIGGMTLMREFNLADRADLEYQVLIGRNLLAGLAVVDVGRSNTLSQ